ncbi:MAG: hypothetical protein ACYS8K_11450, partial [Planctomycetota bacterium]
SVNGLANTRDISRANTAGPIRQRPGGGEPVLYRETVALIRQARHVTQWYSFWTAQPLSPWPSRYDVAVTYCPGLLAKPAAVHIHRNGWNSWPTPPRPQATSAIHMSHTGDQPVDFRTGLHDSIRTIKGFDQGRWQPFHSNRQVALIEWMSARWPVDADRIHVGMGAWGMMEIKYGHLYATIRGWGEPELTKGFQCWDRARGIWGVPKLYEGRPDDEDPYVAANLTDWVLANPARELPFFFVCAGGGAHYTEEGWPPFPRFCWAMMKSKQPFLFCTARDSAVAEALNKGRLALRRGQSLPAFANCSLDDNIGEGDLRSGNGWNNSQVNGWILWEPGAIVDEPGRWAVTVWVGERCPLPEGTVGLTPRRCQRFRARPGEKFAWANAVLPAPAGTKGARARPAEAPKVVQKGTVTADKYGLVTLEGLRSGRGAPGRGGIPGAGEAGDRPVHTGDQQAARHRRHAVQHGGRRKRALGELLAVGGGDGPEQAGADGLELGQPAVVLAGGRAGDEQRPVRQDHAAHQHRDRHLPVVPVARPAPSPARGGQPAGDLLRRVEPVGIAGVFDPPAVLVAVLDHADVAGVHVPGVPRVVLRAAEGVERVVVGHHQPARGRLSRGLGPTAEAAAHPRAVLPVRAVPPGIVEEAGGAEQVRLDGAGDLALGIEAPPPHVHEAAAGREDVGQHRGRAIGRDGAHAGPRGPERFRAAGVQPLRKDGLA